MQVMENQKANWKPREWEILACNWCFHEFLLQQTWKIAAENFDIGLFQKKSKQVVEDMEFPGATEK